ncbi:unnamed protein product [Echinostoma caproni]|uniref:Reverse transcriptase n=1 Tax=Echinostoma caproni TaxID=27848 RepID=A0A183A2U4_9TREM|nr:unnamed protein product [Echinostoma caproni]
MLNFPRSVSRSIEEVDQCRRASILLANVGGLLNKRDDLEFLISYKSPTIVALNETWLTDDLSDTEVAISGRTLYCVDGCCIRGGVGVAQYVRADIATVQLGCLRDPEGHGEGLFCRAKLTARGYESSSIIHRSPRSSLRITQWDAQMG